MSQSTLQHPEVGEHPHIQINFPTYPRLAHELTILLTLALHTYTPFLLQHTQINAIIQNVVKKLQKINPYTIILAMNQVNPNAESEKELNERLRNTFNDLIERLIPGKEIIRIYQRECLIDYIEETRIVQASVVRGIIWMMLDDSPPNDEEPPPPPPPKSPNSALISSPSSSKRRWKTHLDELTHPVLVPTSPIIPLPPAPTFDAAKESTQSFLRPYYTESAQIPLYVSLINHIFAFLNLSTGWKTLVKIICETVYKLIYLCACITGGHAAINDVIISAAESQLTDSRLSYFARQFRRSIWPSFIYNSAPIELTADRALLHAVLRERIPRKLIFLIDCLRKQNQGIYQIFDTLIDECEDTARNRRLLKVIMISVCESIVEQIET